MKNIKNIIFDLDNTLVDLDKNVKDALKLIFEKLNIQLTKEHLDYFIFLDEELWNSYSYNGVKISKVDIPTKRFEIMFNNFNIKYKNYYQINEWFKEGLIKQTYVLPDVIPTLELLKNNSYNIIIFTNGLSSLQRTRIINSELINFIDKVYVSEDIGYSKPNVNSFDYILKDNNIIKNEVVMIGDSLINDIYGANNYGIKSIWCNFNNYINKTNILPTLEIHNFKTLSTVFKKQGE